MLGPLVLAVCTLVVVSAFGFHLLSAVRSCVGAASLWSKGLSQTVAQLHARVTTGGSMPPCQPLVEWLAVPLGDHQARLAMNQPAPDRALARAGFRRAGNVAEDIGAMINLYVYFGALPLLREPIEAWRRGAALIAELRTLGERIRARSPDAASASERETTRLELDRLDAGFIDVETRFSASLGQASRLTQWLLNVAIALLEANAHWDLAADAAGVGLFVWHPADDAINLDRRAPALRPGPGRAGDAPRPERTGPSG